MAYLQTSPWDLECIKEVSMTTSTRSISNMEDTLDTRDILAYMETLEDNPSESEAEELASLTGLIQEVRDSSGDSPEDGIQIIRDSYFQEYAQELADDIGAIHRDATWPLNCIDWEQAASELQRDYTSVDFDGITYWYR